jgi:hypothetical protein
VARAPSALKRLRLITSPRSAKSSPAYQIPAKVENARSIIAPNLKLRPNEYHPGVRLEGFKVFNTGMQGKVSRLQGCEGFKAIRRLEGFIFRGSCLHCIVVFGF